MREITSKENKEIKLYLSLLKKKTRDENKLFLAYGPDFVKEAYEANLVKEVISFELADSPTILVSKQVFALFKETKTELSPVVVCKIPETKVYVDKILCLADIQDPRNVGALIRSAVAFGFKTVLLSEKTADAFNEIAVRVSKGSIFRCSTIRVDLVKELTKLKNKGYQIVGTEHTEPHNFKKTNSKLVLVLGNEGAGIPVELKPLLDTNFKITTQNVESLNVAVAGSIAMHEIAKWKQ